MEVVKVDFKNTKGIPPSGLCVGVHRGRGDAPKDGGEARRRHRRLVPAT